MATDDSRAAAPSERRPELDGLRAIAIALVLLGHFDLAPFGGGFAGVDVFFVLSGFLITVQYADAGDALPWRRIRGFYLRRFWRIAPAYLAVVAATAALILCARGPGGVTHRLLSLSPLTWLGRISYSSALAG